MKFSLIGAAGYVASRHMKAIKDLGHELVSVYDVHDGLAVLDQYFPDANCFSQMQAYDEFHQSHPLDYVSICSPNYLHVDHIQWAVNKGANVICEKPLVLDPAHLPMLADLEIRTGKKISTILQLRNVAAVRELKEQVLSTTGDYTYKVDIRYVSARGKWYFNSWKGRDACSGGLVTNIGIHLFDLLIWIFGPVRDVELTQFNQHKAEGYLVLDRATVKWFLSVDAGDIPTGGQRSFREMTVDDQVIRFDTGMELLHRQCYEEILAGGGPSIQDATPSIELCHQIRSLAR